MLKKIICLFSILCALLFITIPTYGKEHEDDFTITTNSVTDNYLDLIKANVQISESLTNLLKTLQYNHYITNEIYNYGIYELELQEIRQNLVNYAQSFVGILPYVWGGTSLTYGADCCGFTYALYADFGYSISRTVESQAYDGYSVSYADALPGDILIYPGHVALYIGDGLQVHEPRPGYYVEITEVSSSLIDIRRIIG